MFPKLVVLWFALNLCTIKLINILVSIVKKGTILYDDNDFRKTKKPSNEVLSNENHLVDIAAEGMYRVPSYMPYQE